MKKLILPAFEGLGLTACIASMAHAYVNAFVPPASGDAVKLRCADTWLPAYPT
jgi:hypothetical protein